MNKKINRIEKELAVPSLLEKLACELSASDFNTLLMEIFSLRAESIKPTDLLKQFSINQYSKPANWNLAEYRRLEYEMLKAAEESGVPGVLLSPASLFGSCSAFKAVSQSKIISATRNLEILSDATNMLALYIADGLKNGSLANKSETLHYCTTHRHMRYQATYEENRFPHFGLFTMVSSGQCQSSYQFEIASLTKHIRFYADYWKRTRKHPLIIRLNKRSGYTDIDGFFTRVSDSLTKNLPDIVIEIDSTENNTTYYKGLRATLNIELNDKLSEIGDLGFTDWTQKLLNKPSERLLISSLSLDVQMFLDSL